MWEGEYWGYISPNVSVFHRTKKEKPKLRENEERMLLTVAQIPLAAPTPGPVAEARLSPGLLFPHLRHLCAELCLVPQLCPILCKSMDYIPPGSSVHGILQARILEWAAMPFSRGSSQPRH